MGKPSKIPGNSRNSFSSMNHNFDFITDLKIKSHEIETLFYRLFVGIGFCLSCEQDWLIVPGLQSNARDPESGANGRKEDPGMISKGTVVSVQFYIN
jgi:hypothetical protein